MRTQVAPYFAIAEYLSAAGITGNNQDPINWGPPTAYFFQWNLPASPTDKVPLTAARRNSVSASRLVEPWHHNVTWGRFIAGQEFNLPLAADPARHLHVYRHWTGARIFADFLKGFRTQRFAFWQSR